MRKYQPSQTGEKRTRRTQREKVSSSTENRRANESQRGIDVCIYCIEWEGRVGGGIFMSIICVRRISDVRRRILHGNQRVARIMRAIHTESRTFDARSLRPSQRNRTERWYKTTLA